MINSEEQSSESLPGGNQVDGLPPAFSEKEINTISMGANGAKHSYLF